MKKCEFCNIKVNDYEEQCPLCQSDLIFAGDDEKIENVKHWPEKRMMKIQRRIIFYRIQLFIMLTGLVICFAIDFLFEVRKTPHWSIPVAAWIFLFEHMLKRTITKKAQIPRIISMLAWMLGVLFLFTGKYMGFWRLSYVYFAPIICSVALCLNLIFCMIDKSQNAMVYMLCNILVGIAPCIVFLVTEKKVPAAWSICFIISCVTLLALLIFKGRQTALEIQKRLFM